MGEGDMISISEVVLAVIDLVAEAIWPWHGDNKQDKE
jgi:hypothetical protein